MRELHIDIKNKIATYNARCGSIVCGNNDYRIRFTFDEEWDEYSSKQVRFSWNGKYIDVVILGDSVPVPMLSQATSLTVGVYAGDKLYTTTPAKIPCMLSILCETDRAKPADYYEVNGTLEHRLPVITPADQGKLLQANNGVYELRTRAELTYNEDVGEIVKGIENKVDSVKALVGNLENTGTTIVGTIDNLYNIVGGNIWRLNDLINSEFIHEFDFIANGEKFVKMKCEKSIVSLVGDYSIWYYKENDNLGTFVYCTAWLGTVWDERYQTIITYDNVPLEGIAKKTKAGAVETLTTESKTLIGAINEIVDGGVKLQGGYRNPLDGKWYAKYVNGEFLEELAIATLTGGAQKIVLFDFGLDLNVDSEGVFEFCDKTLNKIWDVLPENVQNQMTELAERATEEFVELLSNICKWITGGFDVFDSFEEFSQNALSNLSNIFVNRDDLGDLNLKDFESLIKTYYIGSLDTLDTTVVGAINELNGIVAGNTWILDEEALLQADSFTKDFKFVSNGIEFEQMVYRDESDGANDYHILQYRNNTTDTYMDAYNDGWIDRAFRTVFTLNTSISLKDIATSGNLKRKDLDTNDKTIVGAINEVNASVDDAKATLQNIIDGYTEVDSAKFAKALTDQGNLNTTNKTVVGAINEVNNKVVNTITKLEDKHAYGITKKSTGVAWEGQSRIHYGDGEYVDIVRLTNIPLVAGENVTFEVDQDNDIVKVNAEVDTSNLATVDKIRDIDSGYSHSTSFNEYGIVTEQDTSIYYALDKGDSVDITLKNKLPIVAGENVTFELDEENQVVKINATGGNPTPTIKYSEGLNYSLNSDGASYSVAGIGSCTDTDLIIPPTYEGLPVTYINDYIFQGYSFNSVYIPKSVTGMYAAFEMCDVGTFYCETETQPDGWYPDWAGNTEVVWGYVIGEPSDPDGGNENVASKFTVEVQGGTTVWDVLRAAQAAGANLSEWNLINTMGHIQTTLGVIYQPFGSGSFGLLKAADLMTMKSAAEVSDWSTIPFSDFTSGGMFKCPLPYFDESNVGQTLTITSQMGVVDATWGNAGGSSLKMPQIRFTTANGYAPEECTTFYVDEENPLKLTVEIAGGGDLQVGDQLQVCRRKRFDGSASNGFRRKFKLQRFAEYVVTEEDVDKRFLTVNIFLADKTRHGLFRDGKEATISPLYLRIRRAKGDIQNNNSGQTVDATFSNIVTIWKSYHRSSQLIRIY